MVFTTRAKGTGYYTDLPPSSRAAALPPPLPTPRPAAAKGVSEQPGDGESGPTIRGLGWAAADAQAPSERGRAIDSAKLNELNAAELEREASVRPGLNLGDSAGAAAGSSAVGRPALSAAPAAGDSQASGARSAMRARDLPGPDENGASEPAAWQPPKAQSGDGRTALNAKFGY
ncbi:hypothetical protein T492DRAFT_10314 [Pavlovales sp. CCMP2436]|nr:hypothetical protein T492DRAFT_10314 [Pavlovales sp. CCMP2436]